jgi:hypothetical protein
MQVSQELQQENEESFEFSGLANDGIISHIDDTLFIVYSIRWHAGMQSVHIYQSDVNLVFSFSAGHLGCISASSIGVQNARNGKIAK